MNHITDLRINGVRVNGGREVQQQIRDNPGGELALPAYAARVDWVSGYQTRTGFDNGTEILGDEPPMYGGLGVGASPQELLLTAIGNCLVATFVGGLSAAKVTIKRLRVEVSGQVNFAAAFAVEEGNPGFLGIDAAVSIETDRDAAEVEALMRKLYPTAPIPATIVHPTPLRLVIEHP